MADVDPFVIEIPRQFLNHPDIEIRGYFQYLHRFLFDIWTRTGGEDDAVANQYVRELYPVVAIGDPRITYVTSSSYQTTGYERIIIVTAASTITLNPNPKVHEKVTVKRVTTGNVILSASQNIDGSSTYTMLLNYEAIDLIYTINNGWLIV